MDLITVEQARHDIVELELPQIVLDIFDERPLPDHLDLHFRLPFQMFSSIGQNQQPYYCKGHVTPLWTDSSGYVIAAYDHSLETCGFFRFDIEGGDVEQPVGMNWQQLLVQEFKFLWELETPDERLKEYGALWGFKYLNELLKDLATVRRDTFERDREWYLSFLKQLSD